MCVIWNVCYTAMDAVPKKLKWRLYLTGYGYAVVSFVALFLIWFCTNIFTWKLDVPTKYNYLQENEAFWNLENSKLAYNYDTDRASNFSYDADIDDDYREDSVEYEESDDYSTKSLNSISKMTETKTLWATMNAIETSNEIDENDNYSPDYLLNGNFMYNQTYRFAYKSKIFPKLATEYPIYGGLFLLSA